MATVLQRLRLRRRDQAGFSLVELTMVVFVMGIVGLTVATSLDSFTRTTKTIQDKGSALADTRVAVERVTRDLRAANPIDEYAIGLYNTEAHFSVYCSAPGVAPCGSNSLRPVVYRVVSNRLERVVGTQAPTILVGPGGPSAVPVAQQKGAVVNAATEPVFTYYDKNGVAFDTATALPRTIHDCARSVQVYLKVMAQSRDTANPVDLVTKVDLRNFNGATC
jgi:type II secretory pathway pseudopilin PulG